MAVIFYDRYSNGNPIFRFFHLSFETITASVKEFDFIQHRLRHDNIVFGKYIAQTQTHTHIHMYVCMVKKNRMHSQYRLGPLFYYKYPQPVPDKHVHGDNFQFAKCHRLKRPPNISMLSVRFRRIIRNAYPCVQMHTHVQTCTYACMADLFVTFNIVSLGFWQYFKIECQHGATRHQTAERGE